MRLILRRYAKEDIAYMIKRTKEFCLQHPLYATVPFSDARLEFMLNSNVTNMLFYCMVVEQINDDGTKQLIAGMGAMLCSFAMSEAKYSDDIFLFVVPEARTYGAAGQLIDAYAQWAMDRKAVIIRITYTAMLNPEGFTKLMERHKFVQSGLMFILKRA